MPATSRPSSCRRRFAARRSAGRRSPRSTCCCMRQARASQPWLGGSRHEPSHGAWQRLNPLVHIRPKHRPPERVRDGPRPCELGGCVLFCALWASSVAWQCAARWVLLPRSCSFDVSPVFAFSWPAARVPLPKAVPWTRRAGAMAARYWPLTARAAMPRFASPCWPRTTISPASSTPIASRWARFPLAQPPHAPVARRQQSTTRRRLNTKLPCRGRLPAFLPRPFPPATAIVKVPSVGSAARANASAPTAARLQRIRSQPAPIREDNAGIRQTRSAVRRPPPNACAYSDDICCLN